MGNKRLNGRDRFYIRKDVNGIAISGSAMWRKRIPRGQGNWTDITECVINCCDTVPTGSFLIFQLTSLDGDTEVTSITYPGFSWSGSLQLGDYLVVPLPYNFNEDITVNVLVPSADMAIATSTVQGTGSISSSESVISTDADPQTFVLSVDAVPNSQYLVVLSDD